MLTWSCVGLLALGYRRFIKGGQLVLTTVARGDKFNVFIRATKDVETDITAYIKVSPMGQVVQHAVHAASTPPPPHQC